jgi:hypothetical protein
MQNAVKWSIRSISLLVIYLTVCFGQLATAEAAETVDEVQVEVTAASNLPNLVRQRMEKSVQAIAEQLLQGQPLDIIAAGCQQDENVIHEVFDKVLVGYSVRDVEIRPGQITKVTVHLLPWDDVINQVEVEIAVDGMPPEIETLVRHDLIGVDTVFTESLAGLPLAAADWTNGVLKHSLNDFMAEHLPEFRADFDVVPSETAKVKIMVYPRLPVVRTIDINMRSDTVVNLFLVNHRDLLREKADLMLGVPTAFVARHQQSFEQMLADTLDSRQDFRDFGMHTKVDLTIGECMKVMSRSDTSRYRIRLEGWADVSHRAGEEDHNSRFRLHAGQMLSGQDELFLRTDFFPQAVDWRWNLGYERILHRNTWADIFYDISAGEPGAALGYRFLPRWQMRYEYRWADHRGEMAVRYKMHDFLSLEYVLDNHDSWLRLIGDF